MCIPATTFGRKDVQVQGLTEVAAGCQEANQLSGRLFHLSVSPEAPSPLIARVTVSYTSLNVYPPEHIHPGPCTRSSVGLGLAYLRVTVRIPNPVAVQLRQCAKTFGWQLADLHRTLTCLGAAVIILCHKDEARQEAATTLMAGMKPLRLSRSFTLNFKPYRRPYAFRHTFRGSTLITLSLPQSLRDLIATHAELARVSRNEVYSKCLQQGFLIYLKAHEKTLAPSVLKEKALANQSPENKGDLG